MSETKENEIIKTPTFLKWNSKTTDKKQSKKDPSKPKYIRSSGLKQISDKFYYRRAFSETQLFDLFDLDFKDNEIYNIITGGDVDGLSYLKLILRKQNVNHLIISTWVMALEDVWQIEEWIKEKKLNIVEFYLGEIFPSQYSRVFNEVKRITAGNNGLYKIFRNHAKIITGAGNKFNFGIQMSCNINTNPRAENASITINKEIYEFYKEYFEQIISII